MQTPRPLRSTAVRAGLTLAGAFAVTAVALVGFIYFSAIGHLNRETDQAIGADAGALLERYLAGGADAVIATVDDRIALDLDEERFYLVADEAHRTLAGNVGAWPAGLRAPGWFDMALRRGTRTVPVRLLHAELGGTLHLLVGRDVADRADLRALVIDALVVASLLLALLAGAGGWLLRGTLLRRIEAINHATAGIGHGDTSRRVPVAGTGDEFDFLSAIVNRMLDQIAVLMAGARELSNAIAHDLRTPLARVRGRLEEIARDQSLPRDRLDDVQQAIGQIDGLIAVFNAILRIAEIDSGARREGFAMLDLGAVVRDAADLYAAVAQERGLAFEVAPMPVARVLGDRHMIAQALANLLDNAIKYGAPGGRVEISLARSAGRVQVVLADTGPGIPAAEKPKVIERFYRMEQARGTPGSGLGLSLVAAVARLHGGVLRLEDNRPTGLRAVLDLPIQAPEALAAD